MTLPAAAWRERVEFERRVVHMGGTLYPVPYLLGWLSWDVTAGLLLAGVVIVGVLETLRLTGAAGPLAPVYDALVREYEADGIAGYALYQISMTGVALLAATSVTTPTLAIPAMWMLSLGDPISGSLGNNGPTEPKRPAVWLAMGLVCLAIAAAFTVPAFGMITGVGVAAAGATGATVADGLPPVLRGVAVDDNLTIPPAALAAMGAAVAVLA